jgi:hypothetical protein
MKELFNESNDSEQIRLMTIAPTSWGRVMVSKWFGSTDHHARQAILLRREKKVLAFPEYSRGNKFLDHETIQLRCDAKVMRQIAIDATISHFIF